MADRRPPAPQPPPCIPSVVPPAPPVQLPAPPVQLIGPPAQPVIPPDPMPQLHLSHFQPEFAGKPDKDVEAHLLRTNDWMDTHAFPEGVKVQQLSLTLVGEARVWYESLKHINLDWSRLQNQFQQQYSKIGNAREQFFHIWRSCHFDKNTETLDAYVTCIRQIATLLGYGKPQVLEVFKNTLPARLYLVLLHIEDLRLAVETTKRILTKEKIYRQLAGQSSSTPFMNIKDGYNSKNVTFDMQDSLDEK